MRLIKIQKGSSQLSSKSLPHSSTPSLTNRHNLTTSQPHYWSHVRTFSPSSFHILQTYPFTQATFPLKIKLALNLPPLKKPGFPKSELSNFRSVSNLNTIGKILERLALACLFSYISNAISQPALRYLELTCLQEIVRSIEAERSRSQIPMLARFRERLYNIIPERKGCVRWKVGGRLRGKKSERKLNIRDGNCDEVNLLRCFIVRVLL